MRTARASPCGPARAAGERKLIASRRAGAGLHGGESPRFHGGFARSSPASRRALVASSRRRASSMSNRMLAPAHASACSGRAPRARGRSSPRATLPSRPCRQGSSSPCPRGGSEKEGRERLDRPASSRDEWCRRAHGSP